MADLSMLECDIRWVLEKANCTYFFEKGNGKTVQHFTVLSGAGQYCSNSVRSFKGLPNFWN